MATNPSSIFKALADPTRLEIVRRLRRKELTPGELSLHFKISKPSLSHHLSLLKQTELIRSQKRGQKIFYSLNSAVFYDALNQLVQSFK
jgi:ArsR family transcriptional regulator, arsenate/arsenite/antimonite-responsive transcriptional repressor